MEEPDYGNRIPPKSPKSYKLLHRPQVLGVMGESSRTSQKSSAQAQSRARGDAHPQVPLAGRSSEDTAVLGSGDHQIAGYRSSLAQAGEQGGLRLRLQLVLTAGMGTWPRLDAAQVRWVVSNKGTRRGLGSRP